MHMYMYTYMYKYMYMYMYMYTLIYRERGREYVGIRFRIPSRGPSFYPFSKPETLNQHDKAPKSPSWGIIVRGTIIPITDS